MRCEDFRTRIWDRDGETRTHAAACSSCAALAKSLDVEIELLSKARVPQAPAELWARIEARVPTAAIAVHPWPFRWLAAAVALVAAALGLFLFAGTPNRRSVPRLDLRIVESPQSLPGVVPSYDDLGGLALEEKK
jgi:hypothetical protein